MRAAGVGLKSNENESGFPGLWRKSQVMWHLTVIDRFRLITHTLLTSACAQAIIPE